MGNSVGFYCSSSDCKALQQYAVSIGLSVVPPILGNSVSDDPELGSFCYLSVIAENELTPYGSPPVKISDATDPLIGFMRAYYKHPYLVLGHIYWSNDVPDLAKKTRSFYQKLAKWIKGNWEKYGDFYIGPEAKELFNKGAKMVNVLPGQSGLETVHVK